MRATKPLLKVRWVKPEVLRNYNPRNKSFFPTKLASGVRFFTSRLRLRNSTQYSLHARKNVKKLRYLLQTRKIDRTPIAPILKLASNNVHERFVQYAHMCVHSHVARMCVQDGARYEQIYWIIHEL